jgi:hypothetical protein
MNLRMIGFDGLEREPTASGFGRLILVHKIPLLHLSEPFCLPWLGGLSWMDISGRT